MCLLQFGVGVGNQGTGLAQAETLLPEQSLALAHAQTDTETPCDPCPERLAIPQRAVQSAVPRRLAQRLVDFLQLRFAQTPGTAAAPALGQSAQPTGFEPLHPILDGARGVAQQAPHLRATHSLGHQQHTVQAVIVAGLLGAADFVLQPQDHGRGVGYTQGSHANITSYFAYYAQLLMASSIGPFFGNLANPSGLEFGPPGSTLGDSSISAGLLDYNNSVVNSDYHGLTVTANERVKYFRMVANYTYSHTIDNGNFTTFINYPINQFDYSAERANSNQDLRHHLVTNLAATTPDHTFLRNFELSSIITLQSGRPFTLYAGENVLGDVSGLDTDRVGGPPVTGACTDVAHCAPAVGRNTYVGPAFYAWDLRLSRNFKLREDRALLLSVDSFNMLNHPNVDEINSIYGSPAFCGANPSIPQHYNDATTLAIQQGKPSASCSTQQVVGNPGAWVADGVLPVGIPNAPDTNFATPRTMFNPRQFQFSAKFSF